MFEDLKPTWLCKATSKVVVASVTAEVEGNGELGACNLTKSESRHQFRPDRRRGKIVGLHALSCTVIRPNSQQYVMGGQDAGKILQKV